MEANPALLSLEYDSFFDSIPDLTWYPWVGCNYSSAKRKVLIVGETHYNTGEKVEQANEKTIGDKDTTRYVVRIYPLTHSYKNRMYENLHLCLFKTKEFDREKVWSNIAFYNFVQRPMNYNGKLWQKERPNGNEYQKGWAVFWEVVKILRPTDCLFVGVTAANIFNDCAKLYGWNYNGVQKQKVEKSRCGARHFSILIDGYNLNCIAIQHTSHHFSWNAWHSYLMKANTEMMEFLNELSVRT